MHPIPMRDHLVMAHRSGLSTQPEVVAELGPGDSLGIGMAALLTGAEVYYAFDVVEYASNQRNHHHALDLGVMQGEWLQNRGQMIGSPFLVDHLIVVIEYHDHTVVCMQSNPAV